MSDILQDAFALQSQNEAEKPALPSHPEEAKLIKSAKEFLYPLPTGAILVDFMNAYNIPVHVIVGKEIDFSSPDHKSVILVAPRTLTNKINELALCMACGLRTVQNTVQGFTPTASSPDSLEWKNEQAAKILDIIIIMCKLAKENLDVNKDSKFIDVIRGLGHSDIYEAFLNKAEYSELEKIMLQSINKS
jgi:hypothetical protein